MIKYCAVLAMVLGSMVFCPLLLSAQAKVFALCYHTFKGDPRIATDISQEELRSHVRTLKEKGFTFVSFDDIRNNRVAGTKNILFTIDDGNVTAYRVYQEILKPAGIKPLLAIYPNIIGKKKYVMNWDQLRELSADGCECAAHGYYHLFVNQKLYDKDRQGFMKEIVLSKKILGSKLGRPIDVFVYPFGVRSPITVETIRQTGYRYAFTIDWGEIAVGTQDTFELPRFMLTRNAWKGILNEITALSGASTGTSRRGTTASGRPYQPLMYLGGIPEHLLTPSMELPSGRKER